MLGVDRVQARHPPLLNRKPPRVRGARWPVDPSEDIPEYLVFICGKNRRVRGDGRLRRVHAPSLYRISRRGVGRRRAGCLPQLLPANASPST